MALFYHFLSALHELWGCQVYGQRQDWQQPRAAHWWLGTRVLVRELMPKKAMQGVVTDLQVPVARYSPVWLFSPHLLLPLKLS